MNELESFVRARLDDTDLPPKVIRTYEQIMILARELRTAGTRSDEQSWLTGAIPLVKIGEYLLGADAASEANQFSDQLFATLASTWTTHKDFNADWNDMLLPDTQ